MNHANFAICIVSFQRALLTTRCIASIRENTCCLYRIFLVDNASPDDATKQLLRSVESDSDIELIRLKENYGPAKGRNAALEIIGKEFNFIAMLDNDIVVLPDWDSAAVAAFQRGADLIQPKLLTLDQQFIERGPNIPRQEKISANPEFIGIGKDRYHTSVSQEQEVAIVGAGLYRRSVFDTIGYYNEQLHIGEDFDISFRARQRGFTLLYIPGCEMIHDHGFELEYDQVRSRLIKYLSSHVVFWQQHHKVLLSPAYFQWYSWLHFNNQPMYLPVKKTVKSVPQRIRRRIARARIMKRYPAVWSSAGEADRDTRLLAQKLEMTH